MTTRMSTISQTCRAWVDHRCAWEGEGGTSRRERDEVRYVGSYGKVPRLRLHPTPGPSDRSQPEIDVRCNRSTVRNRSALLLIREENSVTTVGRTPGPVIDFDRHGEQTPPP